MKSKLRSIATLLLLLSSFSLAAQVSTPVVIYSTTWCPYCKQAKAYFDSIGVSYVENDIENSIQARETYKSLNGRGIPLVFIGTNRFDGYDPVAFEQALITEGLVKSSDNHAHS